MSENTHTHTCEKALKLFSSGFQLFKGNGSEKLPHTFISSYDRGKKVTNRHEILPSIIFFVLKSRENDMLKWRTSVIQLLLFF